MPASPRSSSLVTSKDWAHLASAYLNFGADVWDRSWRMGAGYLQRGAKVAINQGLQSDPDAAEDLLGAFLTGLQSYCADMATVLPVALDGLSRDLDGHVTDHPSEIPTPAGSAPPQPKIYQVKNVPVVLPVRIVDCSQGLAIYFVSAARAQAQLDKITEQFTIVETGGGRTPLTILGCDYRETDLGKYSEIGITLFVRPRADPNEMPGNVFLSLSVNQEFNLHRASALWGYSKTLANNLVVDYRADKVNFWLDPNNPALAVSFPRFGTGRATDVPIYTYGLSKKDDKAPQKTTEEHDVPLKTLISRSATGQGMQIGGNVQLLLGDPAEPKGCVCKLENFSNVTQRCVCEILSDLGLSKDSKPAANGWLEHMFASVSPAMRCKKFYPANAAPAGSHPGSA